MNDRPSHQPRGAAGARGAVEDLGVTVPRPLLKESVRWRLSLQAALEACVGFCKCRDARRGPTGPRTCRALKQQQQQT